PPLYRYKKGKKEIYLKDEKALNEFLIENGIENISFEGVGNNDLIEFLKIVAVYRSYLKELEKRFNILKALRFLIENDEIIGKSYDEIFKLISEEIAKNGHNILNSNIKDDEIRIYAQTTDGLQELVINDKLFSNPLFSSSTQIYKKIKDYDINLGKDILEILDDVEKNAKKGAYIQRYKGLGEMNPEQLWETTMDPENRRLIKISVDDAQSASETFNLFMGDEVEPRRNYIEEHAKDVKQLDV
ncbi:DNA gyrase subunit B, partial [Campylobacter sp. RM12321]|nr:DNA gyrase subunit B [Campylobacter sp. RM12321]